MARFRDIVGTMLRQYRGREIGRRPDGMIAAFDGPVRALHCGLALREAAEQLDMVVRAGVHTGEVEIAGDDIGGAAVNAAAAIAAVAHAGEILASTTVRDIVPGSGMHFADASDRVPAGEADLPRLLILGSDSATVTMAPSRRAPASVQLSRREREILAVVARGMTNAEIAASLELSEHTVKRHVANILTKLDLANRSAAAAFAVQHGLV